MDFCKEFNGQSRPSLSYSLSLRFLRAQLAPPLPPTTTARTAHLTPGTPTPVFITIQPDRTFTFVHKTPPTSYLIRQAAGIELGSGEAGKVAGTLSLKHVYEIAKVKQTDEHLRHLDLEAIARSVVGSCKSAGVAIVP